MGWVGAVESKEGFKREEMRWSVWRIETRTTRLDHEAESGVLQRRGAARHQTDENSKKPKRRRIRAGKAIKGNKGRKGAEQGDRHGKKLWSWRYIRQQSIAWEKLLQLREEEQRQKQRAESRLKSKANHSTLQQNNVDCSIKNMARQNSEGGQCETEARHFALRSAAHSTAFLQPPSIPLQPKHSIIHSHNTTNENMNDLEVRGDGAEGADSAFFWQITWECWAEACWEASWEKVICLHRNIDRQIQWRKQGTNKRISSRWAYCIQKTSAESQKNSQQTAHPKWRCRKGRE